MCGIVGYTGHRNPSNVVLTGLSRLEYRGYDSAGIAVLNSSLHVVKTAGKVADLVEKTKESNISGIHTALGHTRWATHGVPNDTNAHPHFSNSGRFAIVHNGIIENYEPLKQMLIQRGYSFQSETDTEVLINLIEDVFLNEKVSLPKAVQLALCQVVGAYAIGVLDKEAPGQIVAAKLGSPLAIGIGEDEFFIASDASPFIQYTNRTIYLEDYELAVVHPSKGLQIKKVHDFSSVDPYIEELKLSLESIEKGGYEHFMLKEIFEQPQAIMDTFRGRMLVDDNLIKLSGLEDHLDTFLTADRIICLACGTSWHAALVAEYIFEELLRIPVEVEYASEFRYRNPVINSGDIVIAISQSGETADTLAAIKLAKSLGAFVFGVCNVVGSSIARETDTGAYTHAGPEIGVASTKAFTTQITILSLIAARLAQAKHTITEEAFQEFLGALEKIPQQIKEVLSKSEEIKSIAQAYHKATNCLYLGRGYNFPVALEGALKLKEISYIHAEGYPAAEMKHGPIALIDEQMPVVVIATRKGHYEKVVSNIQEIKSRKGKIIAVVTVGDEAVAALADHVIEIPETSEMLTPLLSTIPLQLLSYYIAVLRGCNVDQPRNLAKSVTVE
jgi:glucosamine--fructose-6-phosphate aminotransferase (isomerizing)